MTLLKAVALCNALGEEGGGTTSAIAKLSAMDTASNTTRTR